MILDHLEPIELADDELSKHHNELVSLRYLAQGRGFLASQVSGIEARILAQNKKERRVSAMMIGAPPGYEWIPLGLLASVFHWYAVSACNYVRLAGWLSSSDPQATTAYVQKVLPEVYVWRNKVAAHFAITDPRQEDTPADLAASVLFPVGFLDHSFVASPLTLGKGGAGGGSTSRSGMTWSLSDTHVQLAARFWPDQLTS